MRALLIAAVLTLCGCSLHAQTVVKIVDGDTFKAAWNGDTVTVRLCGVDTPELHANPKAKKDAARSGQDIETITAMGELAKDFLAKLIPPGTEVQFEFDVRDHDRYGRLLAYVSKPGYPSVNEVLVTSGYATTMTIAPNVKYADLFRQREREAREKKLGLWKD